LLLLSDKLRDKRPYLFAARLRKSIAGHGRRRSSAVAVPSCNRVLKARKLGGHRRIEIGGELCPAWWTGGTGQGCLAPGQSTLDGFHVGTKSVAVALRTCEQERPLVAFRPPHQPLQVGQLFLHVEGAHHLPGIRARLRDKPHAGSAYHHQDGKSRREKGGLAQDRGRRKSEAHGGRSLRPRLGRRNARDILSQASDVNRRQPHR
jgi:hypothetical protein